jgi:hypothetical protein
MPHASTPDGIDKRILPAKASAALAADVIGAGRSARVVGTARRKGPSVNADQFSTKPR